MKKFLLILLGICLISPSLSLHAQQVKKEKERVSEEIQSPEMYVSNNTLYITNAPIGAKLQIITIVGNKVREIEIQSRNVTHELNLPKAIYIFKLEGMVRKFVIK
ncbi:MAG: hypothetical protein LBS46_04305 [Dysgonamonadaceae bacterium]|jgi:uncharacterized membrane protein|nr:hypothetical protein [Dysgonamonadaceae bacterium]